MPLALLGLGSNLGDRRQLLQSAASRLAALPGSTLLAVSRWHETTPAGGPPGQGLFLNGAALLETSLSPEQLHARLQQIERALGRVPSARWDARPIDLDLLLYDEAIVDLPALVVPHPRMAWRRFVLEPASEVAAAMVHPKIGWTISELLEHLRTAKPYVALTGVPSSGKTDLAKDLTNSLGGLVLPDLTLPLVPHNAADPSGSELARQIQFLDRRADWLVGSVSKRHPPEYKFSFVISDFHFDQSLAYARLALDDHAIADFVARWQELRGRVAQPKLLVVLPPRPENERIHHEPPLDKLHQELMKLASRPNIGPVLFAPQDSDAQFAEVLAAVQAMQ